MRFRDFGLQIALLLWRLLVKGGAGVGFEPWRISGMVNAEALTLRPHDVFEETPVDRLQVEVADNPRVRLEVGEGIAMPLPARYLGEAVLNRLRTSF